MRLFYSGSRLCVLLCRILLVGLLEMVGCTSIVAQFVNNATRTPTPGAGHNYIQMLNETVDPSNGSLTLNIGIDLPPGRRLDLPFTLTYHSGGAYVLHGSPEIPAWDGTTNMTHATGGWEATVPRLNAAIVSYQEIAGSHTVTCDIMTGYVFHDATGGRHPLGIADGLGNPSYCPSGPLVTSGGDGYYGAELTASGGYAPTVSSADGTVYVFNNSGSFLYSGNMPSFAEDRNGNILTFTPLGSQTDGSTGFSETDTLDRTVLSVTTQGANNLINAVTVSGVSQPYQVAWQSFAPSFSTQVYPSGVSGYSTCSTTSTWNYDSGALSFVKSLTLPNNKQYTFYYDGAYGLLNMVKYPSGGYIQYVWGPNVKSEYGQWLFHTATPPPGDVLCAGYYDSIALQHRYVSFDGSTIAQQQDFSYTTAWSPTSTDLWVTKTTTVTTHDFICISSLRVYYWMIPHLMK